MSLPAIIRGDGTTLFDVQGPASGRQFILFFISISISRSVMFMASLPTHGSPSIAALKTIVNDFINAIENNRLVMLDSISILCLARC
jgi:chemotaxis protein CheC